MQIDIITLFPEMFEALGYGMPGQAQKRELLKIIPHQLRDYTDDPNRTVDDRPFGGGPGMVMKAEPIRNALADIKTSNPGPVIYLSPQGKTFDDKKAREFVQNQQNLILLCGRYEGIDERVIQHDIDEEWSIGEYILSGGEIAALAVCDALSRFIPDVLGHSDSSEQDSFAHGLLDHPHFTRPECLDEQKVPDILLSGHHENIKKWRKMQSLGVTWLKKPELFNKITLSSEEKALLNKFKESLTGV